MAIKFRTKDDCIQLNILFLNYSKIMGFEKWLEPWGSIF